MLRLVGKINLDNYDDKKILGHEETFKERIKKRKEQLLKFNSQISPIYATYKSKPNSLKKLKKFLNLSQTIILNQRINAGMNFGSLKQTNIEKLLKNYLKILKKFIFVMDIIEFRP